MKTYKELITIDSFEDRLKYLHIPGHVGEATFGGHRQLNQVLYKSDIWNKVRREVIIRDDGYDLAHPDVLIRGNVYVHHIEPITIDDILNRHPKVFDLNNLVSSSFQTHNAIHYGGEMHLLIKPVTRKPYDTCPWR